MCAPATQSLSRLALANICWRVALACVLSMSNSITTSGLANCTAWLCTISPQTSRLWFCEQHSVHLFRAITGGLQIALHHAQGWPEALRRARVDQHQVTACIDQVCVDGGLHALTGVNEHARQQALNRSEEH